MKDYKNNNYYIRIKPKMMKEFNSMFRATQELLKPYFNINKISKIKKECLSRYVNLFSELPYLGGNKSNSTINLIMGAIVLSIIIPLENEGLSRQHIGKIIFHTFEGYFKSKPKIIRNLIGKIASTKFFINGIKKDIDNSLLRKYDEDFVLEHIDLMDHQFDFGYNYTECALHKLFTKKDKVEYLQYVCLGDYAMFQSYGMGFYRTQTIGNGDPICDFRFKKKTQTLNGWPPDKLPEWKSIE